MAKRVSRFGSNVTADIARRKKEGSTYGYLKLPQGVSMFKESAKVRVDIIPYIVSDPHHMDGNPEYPDAANPGNPWYKKPIYIHRNVGADNESIVCPKTIGKKCPICEHRSKQQSQGVDKESLIDKAQLRNLYVVIPKGSKDYEENFHIWDISNALFQKQLDEELSENPSNGNFPDPIDGKTLSIRFTEKTFAKNKYFETSRIDFEEREEGYKDSIMDKAPNLDDMISIYPYKELEKMFLELDEEEEEEEEPTSKKKQVEEEEEEEEAQPKRKKVVDEEDGLHPFRKKKTAVVEEEEPTPKAAKKKSIVEEEEEEEEEERPLKKKRTVESETEAPSIRRKKTVADEEVVEVEEDDDEEPTPKKKVSNSPTKSQGVKGECPAKHTFGVDWDSYDDCDDCPVFKACGAAHEKK